jgi:hypothetical protein
MRSPTHRSKSVDPSHSLVRAWQTPTTFLVFLSIFKLVKSLNCPSLILIITQKQWWKDKKKKKKLLEVSFILIPFAFKSNVVIPLCIQSFKGQRNPWIIANFLKGYISYFIMHPKCKRTNLSTINALMINESHEKRLVCPE